MNLPGDASGCKALWTAVVDRALRDVTGALDGVPRDARHREQQRAARWIGQGRGFLDACDLAGLDGELIRQRWNAGTLNLDALRNVSQRSKTNKEAA